MKVKYLINNQPVKNLRAWCEERKLAYKTFKQSLYRAKLADKKDCICKGYYIVRL